MAARLPLLHKTPFVLDARPLAEATSPHAGALSISRAGRALGLPQLIEANLSLRQRQRGFAEAQLIESISLLQTVVVGKNSIPSENAGLPRHFPESSAA